MLLLNFQTAILQYSFKLKLQFTMHFTEFIYDHHPTCPITLHQAKSCLLVPAMNSQKAID